MIYPSAGIATSTGTSWGSSITDNSSNWNTAFSWGNHAGLYKAIGYVPTWAEITGKPTIGTVTSVGLSVPSWLSVSNTPITTSGTISVVPASGQAANNFLATPDGSVGAVGLRNMTINDLSGIPVQSGNFTPTLVSISNISSIAVVSATYSQINSVVTGCVKIDITPTVGNVYTNFTFTLPNGDGGDGGGSVSPIKLVSSYNGFNGEVDIDSSLGSYGTAGFMSQGNVSTRICLLFQYYKASL